MTASQTAKKIGQRPALIVPSMPTIDKYVAATRVILDGSREGVDFRVHFFNRNQPTAAEIAEWDGLVTGSTVLVDVGDRKYHTLYPSAAEAELDRSETKGSTVWNRMVPVINYNNRSGFLKSLPNSIAALVRVIPHTFSDRDRGMVETWVYGMHAVRASFRPQNRRSWDDLRSNPEYRELYRLWQGFNAPADGSVHLSGAHMRELATEVRQVNETYPATDGQAGLNLTLEAVLQAVPAFTLHGYFKRMFLAGDSPSEITKTISWWLDKQKVARRKQAEADRKGYRLEQFEVVPGSKVGAGFVRVDNFFEGRAVMRRYLQSADSPLALLVIQMPTGGHLLATSGRHLTDMGEVFQELVRREPGKWYLEGRFSSGTVQFAMNQSWQFTGVEPTALKRVDFVRLIQDKGVYHGKK